MSACRYRIRGNKLDVEACQNESSRENKVNLNFTLDLNDSELQISESPSKKFMTNEILQRKPSVTFNSYDSMDDDTFEHILQLMLQVLGKLCWGKKESSTPIAATPKKIPFYKTVKVTEIYDVSDSDSPIVQTSHEQDINQKLEFDDDWGRIHLGGATGSR
ncbi:hypothetical protein NQ317_001420 [Molorchus minor]|uniref:Uncharacterized protein n=1 Tax=Molorchus minor TaxID=1323400 RepID=A0ABQ9JYD1_9CUCU|nr:hypothetical protein NQ317_001420 [Molorchus minor]